ncbi:MAG TPA: tetratricopeptide repeat protein [Gammaproteobacteria bacterium]|nr:tetratricopeptide repeat protein [Gammaproteobacteria bacterium]
MTKHNIGAYITSIALASSVTPAWAATAVAPQAPTTSSAMATGISNAQLSHQEILTYLLKADMAAQRNMYDEALDNYLIVAKYTRDPQVAQLATEMAVQTQSATKAMDAADIWASTQSDDLQAQLVAATLFISNDPQKAMVFLNNAFEIKSPDIDQHLIMIMNQLSPTGQKNLTTIIMKLAEQRKKDPYVQLTAAQISAVQMDIPNASKYVERALQLQGNLTSAIELNAKIIRYKANNDKPALAYLDQQLQKYPSNGELRLFYITALLDNEDTVKAMPQLAILAKDKTYGGEAYLTMGEIYVNDDKIQQASDSIKKALTFSGSADKAKFYLAQIAEYQKDNIAAIKYYEDISEDSEYHTQGFLRAAYLYSLAGNYDDALDILQSAAPTSFDDQKQVLLTEIDILIDAKNVEKALDNCNKVLQIIPEDIDFLYARSVLYGLLDKPKEAERDLRSILVLDPNNANALNALGFTLANQPSRVKEALPFLQKALSQSPENPAFLDSMGWLMFKMGNNQEAITMLDKAYKISGNNEIAAHLGEVLWSSGKKDAAREVWVKALSSAQDPKVIHETLARLKVPLGELKSPANVKTNKAKAN